MSTMDVDSSFWPTLHIRGSQFGSMHWEGRFLIDHSALIFPLSPQPVGKWNGHKKVFFGLSFWNFNGGQRNSVTLGLSAPVFRSGCDRGQMLEGWLPKDNRKPTFEDNSSHCPYGRSSERSSLPEPQAGLSDSQGSKDTASSSPVAVACIPSCNQFWLIS